MSKLRPPRDLVAVSSMFFESVDMGVAEKWIAAYLRYFNERGHGEVPQKFTDPATGCRLGNWVNRQRNLFADRKLSPDQVAILEALPGWRWAKKERDWQTFERGVAAYLVYCETHGHGRVPHEYVDPQSGFRLGYWASHQRGAFAKGGVPQERCDVLEALPFWSWSNRDATFELWVSAFLRFVSDFGHGRVPDRYVDPTTGDKLGNWVQSRRAAHSTGKLSMKHFQRLEELPGWVWSGQRSTVQETESVRQAGSLCNGAQCI